jgi:predicted small secreted protein
MVRKIIALVAIASGFVLTACNTVEGAGRDVESVGKATQDAAT